jgi:hypothetical protein
MSLDEVSSISKRLESQGKMSFLPAVTESQIRVFETEHNLQLPQKFKEWLYFSDGGEFFLPAGIQLYGVAHKPLIDVNEDDRPDETYVVIGALSSGDPIICEKVGEQISIYNHEAGKI